MAITLTQRVANRARGLLAQKGWTQEDLSGATGIPMRTLARRLHPEHASGLLVDELERIADALDVDVETLTTTRELAGAVQA